MPGSVEGSENSRALEYLVVDAHCFCDENAGKVRDPGAAHRRAVVHEGESEAGGSPMIFLWCLSAVLFVAITMKATPAELTGLPEDEAWDTLKRKRTEFCGEQQ
jgi:hypothetical protein